jgi:transposase
MLQNARSITSAAKLLRLDWRSVQAIMNRAVNRGLERGESVALPHLGIDEKSFLRGQSYVTVLTDLDGKRVLDVKPGADAQSARELIEETLTPEQRGSVKAVAMDRGKANIAAVSTALPAADIVFESFHLAQDLNKAVDAVRRTEHKALTAAGDDTLKKTRWQWLRDPHSFGEAELLSFSALTEMHLRTSRAWHHKELFKELYNQPDAIRGKAFFDKWHTGVMRSRIEPMKKVARSFRESLPRILTWFTHRITNALSEGLNSVIQSIKSAARGFRSSENYRIRILFAAGKLNMTP